MKPLNDYEFAGEYKTAVTKLIKSYIHRGARYQEIADKLNREGVDTLSGKGKWYAQSVHNLINK